MMRVSLSVLVTIYLFICMGTVLIVWLILGLNRQRRERRALRHRLRCHMCACEFEDRSTIVLPRCPRCGSLNERYPVSSL